MSKPLKPTDNKALLAFEAMIRAEPLRGLLVEHASLLKKMSAFDENNPEFFDKDIDREWQIFLKGWLACIANNI